MPRVSDRPARRHDDPSLRKVLLEDLRRPGIRREFGRELRELYDFYLTEERREQLEKMAWARRTFLFWAWLFRSLAMKLSPARRLVLLSGVILVTLGSFQATFREVELEIHTAPLGAILLLAVLMLELKDKLLARDEIEVARQVQLALLPRRHPHLEGWSIWSHSRPANFGAR